jgi:hypothetical protein
MIMGFLLFSSYPLMSSFPFQSLLFLIFHCRRSFRSYENGHSLCL